jgi:hypothetical protein
VRSVEAGDQFLVNGIEVLWPDGPEDEEVPKAEARV